MVRLRVKNASFSNYWYFTHNLRGWRYAMMAEPAAFWSVVACGIGAALPGVGYLTWKLFAHYGKAEPLSSGIPLLNTASGYLALESSSKNNS